MNHERRLAALEIRYQRRPERSAPPFDPSRLTTEETAELEHLLAVMRDAGLHRREQLTVLADEQLHRCEILHLKGWGMDTAKVERN